MDFDTEVRPGANRYVSGKGVLKELPLYIKEFKKIVVITGVKSYEIFTDYYGKLDYPTYVYDGSSSMEDAQRLAEEIKTADVILAIGGGRVLDTAKMTRGLLDCELITIPTVVSNCAPFVPVIVVYSQENHEFLRADYTIKSPYLTLVDWEFLLNTPKEYFVAGIGDTLAKWYECDAVTRKLPENEKGAGIRLGIATAKEILDILLNNSDKALKSLEEKQATAEFGLVADTIIELAGCVGGFAAKYGRVSGAHAIHDALSLISETHEVLHGAKVTYGILVQLAYTGEFDEIKALLPQLKALQLPIKLADIKVEKNDPRLKEVATFAASEQAPFNLIDPQITAEKILKAMKELEEFIEGN